MALFDDDDALALQRVAREMIARVEKWFYDTAPQRDVSRYIPDVRITSLVGQAAKVMMDLARLDIERLRLDIQAKTASKLTTEQLLEQLKSELLRLTSEEWAAMDRMRPS